jgi:hypothetical protein
MCKKKVIQSHNTPMEAQGGEEVNSYSFMTPALDVGEWSVSRPGHALPLGKGSLVPTAQDTGWAPDPVWTQEVRRKILFLCQGSKLDHLVIQSIARHYTD